MLPFGKEKEDEKNYFIFNQMNWMGPHMSANHFLFDIEYSVVHFRLDK